MWENWTGSVTGAYYTVCARLLCLMERGDSPPEVWVGVGGVSYQEVEWSIAERYLSFYSRSKKRFMRILQNAEMHFVAAELKDPICHSLEWQIGSFSSEATICTNHGDKSFFFKSS